jgi:opacity protein-like surface antigen
MASYRYYIGAKTDPVRVYLGASAGYTFLKASFTGTLAGFTASNSASETDFTWGGGAGILFKVAERTDIDVGYRYQAIQMSDGHMDVSSVYAGVNFLF